MKEIHFYTSILFIPTYVIPETIHGFNELCSAIKHDDCITTTQMSLLSTLLFDEGFKVFVHDGIFDYYEIKLGSGNERTNRDIKPGHNLFKLWVSGEFDKE